MHGMAAKAQVQLESIRSVFIEMVSGGDVIATGTAFVYSSGGSDYLVSARHCFTGKYPNGEYISEKYKVQPSFVRAHLRYETQTGDVAIVEYPLSTEDCDPTWMDHPRFGASVDVAALPADIPEGLRIDPWTDEPRHRVPVTSPVSIVGYPFGLRAGGGFPIWVRGTIASEPDIPYDGLPAFLVDSRTRTGQSGSPVVAFYLPGQWIPEDDGGWAIASGPTSRLIGVYTGRISAESDLGFVWHHSVLDEMCRRTPEKPG